MSRTGALAVALILLSIFSSFPFLDGNIPLARSSSTSFTFAASGDIGSLTVNTGLSNLNRLQNVNPGFFLGLGDFSYDPSVTGDIWCSQFKSKFNGIQILPGDHDTGGHNSASFGETHSYDNYVNTCSLTLGIPIVCGPVAGNCYGKEYYFDYPAGDPLARFIFASPKIYNVTGVCISSRNCSSQTGQSCTDQYGCWQYSPNDIHYNWVSNSIDDAHAKGIRWVIVGTHKLCISASDATCSIGIAFFNMLVQKKVDLIIQAHDNAYERSKQIALNPAAGCSSIKTDGNGYTLYNAGCVVDSGGRGYYTPGAGTVVMAQGAWENDLYSVNNTSVNGGANAAEAPYFAKLMGSNTAGSGLGFVTYSVSANRIDVQSNFSGTFSDSFSIWAGPNPVPTASWTPTSPQAGQAVSFTASAAGGVAPYSFTWDFGDGGKASGTTVSHTYASAGYFNVTVTVIDSFNNAGTSRTVIAVGSWNSAVACSPTQSTIERVIGKVSIQRNATVPSSVGADYSGGGFELAGGLPYGSSPENWPFSKRSLQPPCFASGIPSFVEIHNVTLTVPPEVATYDCRTAYDQSNGAASFPNGKNCDVVFSIGNASATSCPSCYMHRIYAEIDGDWNASGIAPPIPPSPGQLVDVQGFVYWDPDSFNVPSHNWSGWELHPFTAWRPARASLTASMIISPASPSVGQQVSFTANVSGGAPPYLYAWKFGDGATGTGNSATHAYTAQGSYTVTLNVTDASNRLVSASQILNVAAALTVNFTTSASPRTGSPVSFTATISGGTAPYSYSWNFGDGTATGIGNPAIHSYSIPGNYTVVLTVSDSNTRTATASHIVNVKPGSLAADFSFTPATPSVGQDVNFTATVTGGVAPYLFSWTFGEGSTASGRSVLHSYTATGSFTAILTTSDSSGQTSTVSKTVNISAHGTTTSVTCSPSSIVVNQTSNCTATVTDNSSSGATTPTGNVTFTPGGTCTLVSSSCSVVVTPSASGTLSVSGSYNGDSAHTASSGSTSITVNKRATVTTVTCSPTSIQIGQSTTCTALVSDTSPGTPSAPVGTVSFATGGSGSFTRSPCNLAVVNSTTASCSSVYTPSGIAARTDAITGTYAPSASDPVHTGSSGTFLLDVTIVPLNPTSTSVSCTPSSIVVNQVTTCTATVTDTSTLGAVAPSGTVTFTFTPSGSCTLGSPSGASASCSVNITPTATGTLTVSATYGGDPTHNGSSNSTSVIVNPRTTTATVSCSPSTVVVGQATSCNMIVIDTSPGTLITPSGTVTFTTNGSCTLTGSTGTASCSTSISPTAAGTLSVTASYSGDTNHNNSAGSTAVTVNKRAISTSVSCSPSTVANNTSTNCTATVTDTDVGTITTPTGNVSFSTNSTGAFSSPTCTLAATSTVGVSKCVVSYTPGKTGNHGITGMFAGDSAHTGGSGSVTMTVLSQPNTQSYALIVSAEGKVFKFYQNGTLTLIGQPVTTALRKVAWRPDGSYALIVGDSAILLRYDGTQLTTITTGVTAGYNFWTVSWKPDGSYALIGGSAGLLLKYDGASTKTISNPFPTTIFSISWHPSGSYALLVGRSGLTLTYDGTTFRSFSSGTTYDLNTAAWNPNGQYALIGGLNGVVLKFNGTQVVTLNTSGLTGTNALRAIAFNPSGSIALLVGDSGMVLTYNGSTMTLLPTITSSYLQSVAWSPSGTAYIVGGSGTVITYTNGALTKLPSQGTSQLRGIAWKPA